MRKTMVLPVMRSKSRGRTERHVLLGEVKKNRKNCVLNILCTLRLGLEEMKGFDGEY